MKTILTFLLLQLSLLILAQVEIHEFYNLDYEGGLCNNHVNALSEDHQGLIWMGTQNGVEIYDGSLLETLVHDESNEQSLYSNDIAVIEKGVNGNMFLGTWGEGINKINSITQTITRLPKHNTHKKNFVKSILEDHDKNLWIGSFGGGIYKTDSLHQDYQTIHVDGSEEVNGKFEFIQGLVETEDRIFVISWRDGLGYVDKGSNRLIDARDDENNLLKVKNFSYVLNYGDKLLLSTTWGDLYSYDIKTRSFQFLETFKETAEHRNRITSFCYQADDVIWVSTESGLFMYDLKTDKKTIINAGINGKKHNQNLCSIKDSRGILWFGTSGKGVNRYDTRYHKLNKIRLSVVNPVNVNTVYPLNDSVIMFGTNKGIVLYDKNEKTTSQLICKGGEAKNVAENEITFIHSYEELFLIGTTNGLYTMSKDFQCDVLEVGDKKHFYASSINDIIQIKDETWVSSSDNGVLVIKSDRSSRHYSTRYNKEANLKYDESYCFFEYSNSKILIGAQEGIEIYNSDKDRFEILNFAGKPSNQIMSQVKSIVQDASGDIWIGSHEGIWKCDGDFNGLKKIVLKDCLTNSSVQCLLAVEGEIWVTTVSGMFSLNIKSGNMKCYTTKHGLISNNFPHAGIYRYDSTTLYFGNGNGVAILSLDEKDNGSNDVKLRIRNVYANGQLVELKQCVGSIANDEAVLPYDQNNVTIDVSAVDFSLHHDDKYRFKLEGFDEKWRVKEYDQSTIEYTNLPPGVYTLKMTILDKNNFIQSEVEKQLKIVIRAPFWDRLWFQLLFVCLLLLIVFFVWRIRLIAIKSQKRSLEIKVSQRTEELAIEKEKLKSSNEDLKLSMTIAKAKQELITSNIKYASVIQESILPSLSEISKRIKDAFVLSSPKDIVSGDFFWSTTIDHKSIFIVGDCTGHGVSGAFMSVYAISLLNFIVKEKDITKANLILDELHLNIIDSFQKEGHSIDDSLDITVLVYNHNTNKFYLSGALTKAAIIQNDTLTVFKGDRFPIGGQKDVYKKRGLYTVQEFDNTDDTVIYLYSDGYQDQFHHATDKKLMHKNFISQLKNQHHLPFKEQYNYLEDYLLHWKGNRVQTDDITVIGLKL